MAEIVKNDKGFKVVKMSMHEINVAFGSLGICDACNKGSFVGYYIAVLNSWYCENDYLKFLQYATNYPEDSMVENRNFEIVKQRLNLK